MNPTDSNTAASDTTLRTQLILAQVRLMESEDQRDALKAQLRQVGELLSAAQTAADDALAEERQSRDALASLGSRFAALEQTLAVRDASLAGLRADLERLNEQVSARQQEGETLRARLAAMTESRSWRWTAWLRTLEQRWFRP